MRPLGTNPKLIYLVSFAKLNDKLKTEATNYILKIVAIPSFHDVGQN